MSSWWRFWVRSSSLEGGKKLKKVFSTIILCFVLIFLATSCKIKTDNLDDSTIYTTVYPINYLVKSLFGDHAEISSIYPENCDIENYKLTKKQIKNYSKSDLFVYNGLTNEKEIAKTLVNKNKNLLIIDVSYGLVLNNDDIELWLSPNNYLMLAKNIKSNLIDYLSSKILIEDVENNYKEFEEQISIMDASLHSIGKAAKEKGSNIIVASSSAYKFLENYGFSVISLEDSNNLKDNKLKSIKNHFKSEKYKFILVSDVDKDNELVKELVDDYKAKEVIVDTLTLSLTEDYFDIMTEFIQNIKNNVI